MSEQRYMIAKSSKEDYFIQQLILSSLPTVLPADDPRRHKSMLAAKDALSQKAIEAKTTLLLKGKRNIDLSAAIDLIIENTAITAATTNQKHQVTLAFYDYDDKIYTHNTDILSQYLALLLGSVSTQQLNTATLTLKARRSELIQYWSRPKYLIPVGNGLLDLYNKKLYAYCIEMTITSRIKTHYKPNAKQPSYQDGFTFDELLNTASRGSQSRRQLILQFYSYCLFGYTYNPKILNVIGDTGSGKSTVFRLVRNIIGQDNVADLTYSQIEKEDMLLSAAGSWLIFGDDSRGKVFIKASDFIKIKADNGYYPLSRKFLDSITVQFDMPMLQLMNTQPRIDEAGQQITSRLVWLDMDSSLTKSSKDNDNVREVYIKDTQFHEYVLSYFIDTFKLFDNFSPIDDKHNQSLLDSNDVLGQFYSEMQSRGVMSNTVLPTSHLYAAYADWFAESNPSGKLYSNRGFTHESSRYLKDYGYEPIDIKSRPKSLESSGKYDSQLYNDGEPPPKSKLAESINSNRTSKLYEKKHETQPSLLIRKHSNEVNFITFFRLTYMYDDWVKDILGISDTNSESTTVNAIDEPLEELPVNKILDIDIKAFAESISSESDNKDESTIDDDLLQNTTSRNMVEFDNLLNGDDESVKLVIDKLYEIKEALSYDSKGELTIESIADIDSVKNQLRLFMRNSSNIGDSDIIALRFSLSTVKPIDTLQTLIDFVKTKYLET